MGQGKTHGCAFGQKKKKKTTKKPKREISSKNGEVGRTPQGALEGVNDSKGATLIARGRGI